MRAASAQEKVRWRALYLIAHGEQANRAARRVGRTSGWITQLARRYNERGAKAVPNQKGYCELWLKEGIANRTHSTLETLEKEVCTRCQRITPLDVAALTNYHWWPTL